LLTYKQNTLKISRHIYHLSPHKIPQSWSNCALVTVMKPEVKYMFRAGAMLLHFSNTYYHTLQPTSSHHHHVSIINGRNCKLRMLSNLIPKFVNIRQ